MRVLKGRSNSAGVSVRPRPLSPQDYRLLGLAALGGALEFYDFIIFVFFAVVIGKLFFPPGMPEWLLTIQVFGIFGTGYLVRPLGGIVLAHFGDLFGRKRIFAFSILLMALATLGMASLPVYASIGVAAPVLLVITRILQGAAIGEVPGAWTFVAEHVPSRQVGFGCGVLCAGLTLGILFGVLVAALINEGLHAGRCCRLRVAHSLLYRWHFWADCRVSASLAAGNAGVHRNGEASSSCSGASAQGCFA